MESVMIFATLYKLVLACVAFVGVLIGLRYLDRLAGLNFKNRLNNASDTALSIYLGLRVLAMCYLIGSVISG